jgi:hypothetical protein
VPDHREASHATVQSAVLREMIERTMFSICNDETRFHLNGVFFESDGSKCRMVSIDGHRVPKVEGTFPNGPKLSAGVIIPKKGPARDREGPRAGAERQASGGRPARMGSQARMAKNGKEWQCEGVRRFYLTGQWPISKRESRTFI